MKKRILVLIIGFLFIGVNGFAADGDLIVNGNATVNGNSTVSGNATVNGNVGIGTTNPGYKLDVQGQIRATQGTAVYQINQWCVNGGLLTTATTCLTAICNYDFGYLYSCTGVCGGLPTTCSNTLAGRLLAP